VDVLNALKIQCLQQRHRLATAETSRTIHQNGPLPFQASELPRKLQVIDRKVNCTGQGSVIELRSRTHIKNLGVRMRFQECAGLMGTHIHAHAPGLRAEQPAIPACFEPIPANDNESEDDKDSEHSPPGYRAALMMTIVPYLRSLLKYFAGLALNFLMQGLQQSLISWPA
jgi:hypothetical protein